MSGIVGRGSGSPNGIPDFRPLNPYGREMPKPSRAYRTRPLAHALYQVEIECRDGTTMPFGPKWAEQYAGALAEEVNKAILRGAGLLNGWGRARVALVKPEEKRDTRTIRELLMGVP